MSRPKPLSGFPEFLPAARIVEQRVLASLAETFELHGFGSGSMRETTLSLVLIALGDALMGEQLSESLALPRTSARDTAERMLVSAAAVAANSPGP